MRKIIFSLCLSFALFAKDNPFNNNLNQKDYQTRKEDVNENFLDILNIKMPSSARFVNNIIIEYVNVDGNVAHKKVQVDRSIDWHYPIAFSQREAMRNITNRYFSLNDFEFFIEHKKMIIKSKHKIIREFLLAGPTIVIDYQRDKSDAYSGSMNTGEKIYEKISIETKENSYRVSISLDGVYKYSIKSVDNTQIIGVE